MGLFGRPDISKMISKRDVKGLTRLLVKSGLHTKELWDVIWALGELHDPGAAEPLVALFFQHGSYYNRQGKVKEYSESSDDLFICKRIGISLQNIGEPAVGQIISTLNNSLSTILDEGVRDVLRNTLKALGIPAMDALIFALEDRESSPDLLRVAVDVLGTYTDPRAIGSLIQALGSKWEFVVKAAADSLVNTGKPAVEPLIASLSRTPQAIPVLLRIGDPRAVNALAEILKSNQPDVQNAAAIALGNFGDDRAVDRLAFVLKHKESETRLNAVLALEKCNCQHVLQPLSGVLNDTNHEVRLSAARILVKYNVPDAVKPLADFLKDESSSLRKKSAEILGTISTRKDNLPLLKLAAVALAPALKDKDNDVRQTARNSLLKLCAKSHEPLLAALQCDDCDAAREVVTILEKAGWKPGKDAAGAAYWSLRGNWKECAGIGVPAISPLIDALRDEKNNCRQIEEALSHLGEPAVEPLISATKDSHKQVRTSAIRALGLIGDPRAIEPILACVNDDDMGVGMALEGALEKLGPKAADPLLNMLLNGKRSAQLLAARLLGHFKDKRAVDPLIAMYRKGDDYQKVTAVRALADIGDMRAFDTFMEGFAIARYRTQEDSVYGVGYVHRMFVDGLKQLGIKAEYALIRRSVDYKDKVAIQALDEMGIAPDEVWTLDSKLIARQLVSKYKTYPVEDLVFQLARNYVDFLSQDLLVDIAKAHGRPVIEQLIKFFNDEPDTRYAVVTVIDHLENKKEILTEMRAIDVLVSDLRGGYGKRRQNACRALESLYWQPQAEDDRKLLSRVHEELNQQAAAEAIAALNRKYGKT